MKVVNYYLDNQVYVNIIIQLLNRENIYQTELGRILNKSQPAIREQILYLKKHKIIKCKKDLNKKTKRFLILNKSKILKDLNFYNKRVSESFRKKHAALYDINRVLGLYG